MGELESAYLKEGITMCATLAVTRAHCRPVLTELVILFEKMSDRVRLLMFGEEVLFKELKRLRAEIRRNEDAVNYLCSLIRTEDEVLGRLMRAQLSLFLNQGIPDPMRHCI